jgi:protein SCO1/2
MQVVAHTESPRGMVSAVRKGFLRRASVAAEASLFFFGLAMTAKAQDKSEMAPAQSRGVGIEQRLNNQVPLDLKFRDETGQTVTLGSYFGREPVILSLVYYGCRMMCTLTEYGLVNALRDVQFNIGDQYRVVTVSFNPKDDPDVAMAQKTTYTGLYGRPGAKQGWHFLVGDEHSIHALAQAVGFQYKYMPDIDLYDHPTGIMVLTPKGKVASYFYGVQYRAQDIHQALVDASNEKIANPEDMERRLQKGVAGGGASPAVVCPATTSKSTAPLANHPPAPTPAGAEGRQ